jgi:ubiquitin C-terminal hydrolase
MDDFLDESVKEASSSIIEHEMQESQGMKSKRHFNLDSEFGCEEERRLQNTEYIVLDEIDQTGVLCSNDISFNSTPKKAEFTMNFVDKSCVYSKRAQESLNEIRKHIYLDTTSFEAYVENVLFSNTQNSGACDRYKSSVKMLHNDLSFFNPWEKNDEEDQKFLYAIPPGMQNLGATCYLNTQLQCLARIIPFIDAILEWRPPVSLSRMDVVLSTLQQIMAKVACGAERILSTENFASALGIENNEMQDPNEFARLLLDKMNIAFQQSLQWHGKKAESLGTLLPNLFEGRMTYETACQSCGRVTCKSESFMDINLPIVHSPLLSKIEDDGKVKRRKNTKHSKVNEAPTSIQFCLDNYMCPEELVGDNQYWCVDCRTKTNAMRNVSFSKLPNVLNLQLCRYVFDRNTQTKKKLTDRVQLPHLLKITSTQDSEPRAYRLCSVMKHLGTSAYHGHYIADAMDWQTGFWFQFNDEKVERIGTDWTSSEKGGSLSYDSKEKGCKDAYNIYYVHEPFLRRHSISNVTSQSDVNENNVIRETILDRQRRYSALKE